MCVCVHVSCSAGCFFGGEVRLQSRGSVLSDVDSETERVAEGAPPIEPDDAPKPRIPKVTSDSFISELVSDREGQIGRHEGPPATAGPSIPEEEGVEGELQANTAPVLVFSPSQCGAAAHQWSNVDLEEAQIHLTVGAVADSAETCSLSSVATYNLGLEEQYGPDDHPLWAWVSGGGCAIDSHNQLNWFNSTTGRDGYG